MQLKITNQEDFWAGVMFVVIGLGAIYIARDYPMGSALRMGPGFFPTYLGSIMAALGAFIVATSFITSSDRIRPFAWRPMLLLSLAFIVFGLAIDSLGLVISLAALILLSALAGRDFRVKEVVFLMAILIVGCWALFVHALELPFQLWWWR